MRVTKAALARTALIHRALRLVGLTDLDLTPVLRPNAPVLYRARATVRPGLTATSDYHPTALEAWTDLVERLEGDLGQSVRTVLATAA